MSDKMNTSPFKLKFLPWAVTGAVFVLITYLALSWFGDFVTTQEAAHALSAVGAWIGWLFGWGLSLAQRDA